MNYRVKRAAQFTLGAVLLLAFLTKATDYARLERQIAQMIESLTGLAGGFWGSLSLVKAVALLTIELLLGVMLTSGFRARDAGWAALPLVAFFTITAGLRLAGLFSGDCGCFGVLIDRSPAAALIENIVLLLLAVIGLKTATIPRRRRKLAAGGMLIIGALWWGYFSLFPPPWSSVRAGIAWSVPRSDPPVPAPTECYYWIFDPDCPSCLEQMASLDLITRGALGTVVGLTSASEGRFNEFMYDYDPSFGVYRVDEEFIERLGAPSGTVLFVRNGRVQRIITPEALPLYVKELRDKR